MRRSAYLLVVIALAACERTTAPPGAVDAAAPLPGAGAAPSATPSAAGSSAPPGTGGDGALAVPGWAPDKTTKRCSLDPAIEPKLAAIEKGEAAIGAGTADVAAMAKELGADRCFTNRRALAQALSDRGVALSNEAKTEEANRHLRAALVVRPSLVPARYDLARGLARSGQRDAAVAQVTELARAAAEGDARAASVLEKARGDKVLDGLRDHPALQAALKVSNSGLVGPRQEPATATKAIALLPDELRTTRDELGVTKTGMLVYKPAVTGFWTWHPDASTELLVATIIDDPAKAGRPRAELNQDYGAIAVLRRDPSGKLSLLTVRKTGTSPPSVAAGKEGSVAYTFEQMCGTLSGTMSWNGASIDMREKNCRDL